MKKRLVFVILHYNEPDVTRDAVKHLLELHDSNYCQIVVVDNFSPDGSGETLDNEYRENPFVDVIRTRQNLGFAKGNNFGYRHAKLRYTPEVIVVMNNDVMIEQSDFIHRLFVQRSFFDYEIIMPDIVNKSGVHQNPFRVQPLSTFHIIKEIMSLNLLFLLYNTPIINKIWARRRKRTLFKKTNIAKDADMMIPHGACVIFMPKWVNNEDFAFVPDTFLYGEEDLLYEYATFKNYRTHLSTSLTVKHLEDVSTDSVIKTPIAKSKFLIKNLLHSHKLLFKMRISKNNIRQ